MVNKCEYGRGFIVHDKNFFFSLFSLCNFLCTLLLNYFINFLLDQKVTKTQGCISRRPKTGLPVEQKNSLTKQLYFRAANKLKHVFALRRLHRIGYPAFEIKVVFARRRVYYGTFCHVLSYSVAPF